MMDEFKSMMNLTRSLSFQERARKRVPGMSQLFSKRPEMFSLGVWPGYFSRAKGARIWDLDDNEYLDMSIAGMGANVLGYADPDVDGVVCEAISRGTSSSLNCPEEVELAELLCELHPWAEMARFARTGGEAMAIAVRIARAHTGREKIAFCGYHGWHDWYLAANLENENALGEHLLSGLPPAGVPQGLARTAFPFRYNRIEDLKAIVSSHGRDLAAIVMEPIRNHYPDSGFLEAVRDIAHDLKAVWILDEISSGFRLTCGGAHRVLTAANPDMAVFSKALGNGYPIAAVIGRAEVIEAAQQSFISSTLWTERVGPAAALATIRKHGACSVADHLQRLGTLVQRGWQELAARHGLAIETGGIPPLSHFSFLGDNTGTWKAYFVQQMLARRILASTLFYPMWAHTEEDVALYLKATDQSFAELASAVSRGTVRSELYGKPARSGFRRLT